MRTALVVLAFSAWIPFVWQPIWGQTPGVGKQHGVVKPPSGANGSDKGGDSDQRGTKQLPLVIDTEGHQKTDNERADADAEKQHAREVERRTLFYTGLTAWATVALVLVGVGGIWAALRTLGAIRKQSGLMAKQYKVMARQGVSMRRQTTVMRASLEAAKLGAAATRDSVAVLVNSERAWVVITTIYTAPLVLATASQMENNQFRCAIANKGKTVAKVVEIKGECMIVSPTTVIPELPPYPPRPYDDITQGIGFPHGTLLVPSETSQTVSFYIDQTIDDQILRNINGLKLYLYFYGFIRYFDFAKEERRNQFCYQYIPAWSKGDARWSAVEVTGMPQYNTHT